MLTFEPIWRNLGDREFIETVTSRGVRQTAYAIGVTPRAVRGRRERIMSDAIRVGVSGWLTAHWPIDHAEIPGWEQIKPKLIMECYDKSVPISTFTKIAKSSYDSLYELKLEQISKKVAVEVHTNALELAKEGIALSKRGYRPLKTIANKINALAKKHAVPRAWVHSLVAGKMKSLIESD